MTIRILLKTALRILLRHATRSLLTILGIMIGIAAIVVTFSIGRGAEIRVKEQFSSLGENAMYIIPGNIIERGRVRSSSTKPVTLTMSDLYAIKNECTEVEAISRGHESLQTIEYGPNSAQERINGIEANWPQITDTKTAYGTFFTEHQISRRMNLAVLSSEIAKKLFKNDDPVGKTVRIHKKPFTVIGVMEALSYWGAQDPNTRVFIPFTTAKKYFKKSDEGADDLDFIALSLIKGCNQAVALRKIKRILRFNHDLQENETDDFTIFDQASISSAASAATNVVQLFGLLAASISLLVGGIGVMNIMLVSVQERTKEIGIRLAIGATQANIQLQFLFEAVTLSTLGGIIGIIAGIAVQHFITSATDLPGVIEATPLIISFLITILVGIFFGLYPAKKASQLNPVDALLKK